MMTAWFRVLGVRSSEEKWSHSGYFGKCDGQDLLTDCNCVVRGREELG